MGLQQLTIYSSDPVASSLLNGEVVPFNILDVEAGRETQGHRFLGHPVEIAKADDYEETLNNDFVIADQTKRKNLIKDQITKIISENNWQVDWDEDLLEEVNNLVEWPTAFAGSFDEKYLALPDPVLITSMKDNQRFFCVRDKDGNLLSHFISVRNGNTDYLDNVIKGNERVLVPRLEDAQFFYQEDQKLTIDEYVERLKKVSFHDKISSMYDKMQRVAVIANVLGKQLNLSDEELADLDRAAHIYKFDLTTQWWVNSLSCKELWVKFMLSYSVKKMMLPQLFVNTTCQSLQKGNCHKLRLARS